jgi:putative membrane protein
VSTTAGRPFDPGLQPERTLLAWRRTCLALGVAATVAVRFAAEVLGPFSLVLGAAGIATAVGAYVVAARRYRVAHEALTASGRLPVDGTALGLLTVTLVLTGLACGAYVTGAVTA